MDERLFDLPPLPQTDWTAHNEEQKEVWKRFYEGTPTRVPWCWESIPVFCSATAGIIRGAFPFASI